MVRASSILAAAALASCGSEPAPQAEPAKMEAPPAAAKAAPPAAVVEVEAEESEDAAATLRRYYDLIGERKYEQAARLRSRGAGDAERLADSFKAYRSYNVQVGAPGRPARSGPWLYVNVPVMITGSFTDGKTFGSAGSVTMRRAASDEAPAAGRGWHVYTG